MLIQPAIHVVTMAVDAYAEDNVASDTSPDVAQWKSIIAEHFDVFEPPGMPAEHDTVHQIKLEPGSVPLYKRQYRVSAAELATVRWQLNKYLEKGCVCPSCLPYRAPIVCTWKKTREL